MAGYVDPVANGVVQIDAFHARIHEGTAWSWSKRFEGIANDGIIDVVLTVNTNALHFNGFLEGSGKASIDFVNVGSFTGGTSLGAVNRNFFKSQASQADVLYSASINVVESVIIETLFGSAAGEENGAGAGNTGGFNEFIMGPGTYGFRITNTSGASADYAVQFQWYEPRNAGS